MKPFLEAKIVELAPKLGIVIEKSAPAQAASFLASELAFASSGISASAWSQPSSYFQLSSPAFQDNGIMPKKYAGRNPANPNCVGENISPPLQWANPPAGTKSFALIMFDQEGRFGLGVTHWLAYRIPATTMSLPEAIANQELKAVSQRTQCPQKARVSGRLSTQRNGATSLRVHADRDIARA